MITAPAMTKEKNQSIFVFFSLRKKEKKNDENNRKKKIVDFQIFFSGSIDFILPKNLSPTL
jgi:hypothetical protein